MNLIIYLLYNSLGIATFDRATLDRATLDRVILIGRQKIGRSQDRLQNDRESPPPPHLTVVLWHSIINHRRHVTTENYPRSLHLIFNKGIIVSLQMAGSKHNF